jgi:hypothetical protein
MTKTVYWAPIIVGDDWPLVSELKFYELERLIKRIDPVEFFGPATARCPAMVDELKNTFALRSPLDLHIDFSPDFTRPRCFNETYSPELLQQFINEPNPHRIFQLSYAQVVMFCEDSLTMTQLHPYYEDNEFTDSVMGVSGTLDISSWLRPVQPGFKFKSKKHVLNIKDGDALAYYRFNTDEPVVLKRFDAKGLYSDRASVMQGCLTFKDHKPQRHTYSLKASYEAFKRARYNKKTMKYIKENLLD